MSRTIYSTSLLRHSWHWPFIDVDPVKSFGIMKYSVTTSQSACLTMASSRSTISSKSILPCSQRRNWRKMPSFSDIESSEANLKTSTKLLRNSKLLRLRSRSFPIRKRSFLLGMKFYVLPHCRWNLLKFYILTLLEAILLQAKIVIFGKIFIF